MGHPSVRPALLTAQLDEENNGAGKNSNRHHQQQATSTTGHRREEGLRAEIIKHIPKHSLRAVEGASRQDKKQNSNEKTDATATTCGSGRVDEAIATATGSSKGRTINWQQHRYRGNSSAEAIWLPEAAATTTEEQQATQQQLAAAKNVQASPLKPRSLLQDEHAAQVSPIHPIFLAGDLKEKSDDEHAPDENLNAIEQLRSIKDKNERKKDKGLGEVRKEEGESSNNTDINQLTKQTTQTTKPATQTFCWIISGWRRDQGEREEAANRKAESNMKD